MLNFRNAVLASATFALAATSALASRIDPPQPTSFERVNLRMTVDSCVFNPATVRVRAVGNVLQVMQQPNACLVPGPAQDVDVRLGSLAAGVYQVEVFASLDPSTGPVERIGFEVREPVEVAVFPPPPRPLADYTGLWWNPQQSGWGLSLHQSPLHAVFGAFFVYNANGQPEWYTLQAGQWVDSVTWRGTIYRTTGPSFAGRDYDPRLVLVQAAGSATLDFRIQGSDPRARFTYTIGNTAVTTPIQRMGF